MKKEGPLELLLRSLAFLLVALWMLATPARADIQWPQLKYTLLPSVVGPVDVTNAGDGSNRLFVVTQSGTIRIYQSGQLLTTPFLDISARVYRGESAEAGMFSVAFPPGFATKQYFYLSYSRSSDGAMVLSRFNVPTATPNAANPASEQVLLAIPHPNTIHYAGQLAFGPDGYLYFSVGDGGPEDDPSNNAQNPNLYLGKLLRIDTESGVSPYAIPPTNPFVGVTGYLSEIWALGLRNPWRFSFDRGTGDLYIADVGQNSWEEVDYQPAGSAGGQNYGWRILEGTHPFNVPNGYNTNTLTSPIIQYPHQGTTQNGYAVIGGFVYRGPASRLTGLYLYADYGTGVITGATQVSGQWVTQTLDTVSMQIASFGEDESGQLYIASSSGVYQVQEDTVAHAPFLWGPTGTYNNDTVVTATSTTSNVSIYYTTDGTDPTQNSTLFPTAGLTVSGTTTLNVKAFHPYLSPSATVQGVYNFTVATPTFSPTPTTISPQTGSNITLLSATTGASFYYTLDGSSPTSASTPYTGPIYLAVGPATVKAIGVRANYQQSAVATGNWTEPALGALTISFDGEDPLTISGTGQIHYTLDGTTPTAASPLYSGPISITQPLTIKAIAFGYGYLPSSVDSSALTLYYPDPGVTFDYISGSSQSYYDSPYYYAAQYRAPEGVCVDGNGTLYVADTGNNAIRRTTAYGAVTTFAGNGTAGFVNAAGTNARFNSPCGICRDPAGNLYVTDDGNHVIRKVDSAGNVTTYAGNGTYGSVDGPAAQAQFKDLQGVAMDGSGNLFVGSLGVIRKIDPLGNVSTFATLPESAKVAVAITPDGRLFATAFSPKLYLVAADGTVSVYAGSVAGTSDGNRAVALFQLNRGVAADILGILYVCDGNSVRKIQPNGTVYTMVSSTYSGTYGPLYLPFALAVGNNGYVYIADTGNSWLRMAYPVNWDPASRFQIKSVTPGTAGQMVIQWQSSTGRTYHLYYSSDLQNWGLIGNYPGTGNVLSVNHTPGEVPQVFYKLTLP